MSLSSISKAKIENIVMTRLLHKLRECAIETLTVLQFRPDKEHHEQCDIMYSKEMHSIMNHTWPEQISIKVTVKPQPQTSVTVQQESIDKELAKIKEEYGVELDTLPMIEISLNGLTPFAETVVALLTMKQHNSSRHVYR